MNVSHVPLLCTSVLGLRAGGDTVGYGPLSKPR